MFVITDLEWITNSNGHHSPTQLSAIRVDEQWNTVDEFNSFIRPRDAEFHIWNHVAYTGGKATDFLLARNAHNVLDAFQEWLNDDDVILWWYSESEKLFKKIVSLILKTKEKHKSISINEYVYAFLAGKPYSRGNSYKIAEARGVRTNAKLKHFAKNDARVIQDLMRTIEYPQDDLLKPLSKPLIPSKPNIQFASLPYQYNPKTNVIHIKDCELISDVETQGFETLKNPIRKGFKACSCCKSLYNTALRERNIDIIDRTQYTYIYAPDSNVFHKYTCGMMLSAKSIMGTRKYETVVATGRTPCKVCNPTSNDIYRPLPPQYKIMRLEKKTKTSVSKSAAKAIKRQKLASEERRRMLQVENLTESERNDIFTLTQPRFAFWVGQGYQSFHLHSCSKLHDVSNLKGFGTYQEAISAGYTPCKKCKPTSKHDVKYSIPITNRIRVDEKVEDLETLCIDAEYPHYKEGPYFCIETPVGKWRINVASSPVKLEHINLVESPECDAYHEQPRLFLSFIDTFVYIKRHDDKIIQRVEGNEED